MHILLLLKSLPILIMTLFGQVQNHEEPVYTTRLIKFKDQDAEGCLKMQLSIYATYPNGQVLLAHSAVILSGKECANGDKVLSTKNTSANSGPEYIVKDEQLNGTIEDFIATHPELYPEIVLEKEKVMGILG